MADIKVKVVLPQFNSAPPKWVGKVLSDIERVVYANERQLLREALAEFESSISAVVRDAILYRFEQRRGQALLVTSIEQGSIVIEAFVAALALGVLKITLGESFKEAWKGSDFDQALQGFFRSKLKDVPKAIVKRLAAKYATPNLPLPRTQRQILHHQPDSRAKSSKWMAESINEYEVADGDHIIKVVAIDIAISEFPMTYKELLSSIQINE
jgi:hypothetical protein